MSTLHPLRQTVMGILDQLPDDATIEDLQYHLLLQQRIDRGMRDIAEGRVIDDEEMGRRIQSWGDDSNGRRHQKKT